MTISKCSIEWHDIYQHKKKSIGFIYLKDYVNVFMLFFLVNHMESFVNGDIYGDKVKTWINEAIKEKYVDIMVIYCGKNWVVNQSRKNIINMSTWKSYEGSNWQREYFKVFNCHMQTALNIEENYVILIIWKFW